MITVALFIANLSLVAVNGFITEEGLTTLMIGFYEKLTGETVDQEDVEEDVSVPGSNPSVEFIFNIVERFIFEPKIKT